jgi:C_GCAxxG_C_C family probable redox protein
MLFVFYYCIHRKKEIVHGKWTFSQKLCTFARKTYKIPLAMTNEEIDERVARAVDYFMQGYGCCQSVVAAFSDLYGLDETMAKRIAAGFGGGVGRMRMMCGAVSGIVMLVGLDCGQTEGSDREGKSACYKVVQELLEKSRQENGSLICAEILGIKGYEKAQSSYVASARTAEYYKTRPCAAKVESAARIFAEYLKGKQKNNEIGRS